MNGRPDIQRGRSASVKGFANENRLLAALLQRGYNASKVDLPLSTYDILVEKSRHEIIRIQVKTVGKSGSISFSGGTRGGRDRTYKSDVLSLIHRTPKLSIWLWEWKAAMGIRRLTSTLFLVYI